QRRQKFPDQMANVAVLLFRQRATLCSVLAPALASPKERRIDSVSRNNRRGIMNYVNSSCAIWFVAIASFYVTSCSTVSRHAFSELTVNWQTKTGQLMYRTPNTTLIGDVLVRFSKSGDFELTVSKGPGMTLLSLRQFVFIGGSFMRISDFIARTITQRRGLVWCGVIALAVACIAILITSLQLDSEIFNILPGRFSSVRGLKIYDRDFEQTRELT